MIKRLLTVLFLFFSIQGFPVIKYWKANSGSNSNTLANWFLDAVYTIPATELPRASDSLVFQSGSGNCTIAAALASFSCDLLNYNGTIGGSYTWTISGSLWIGNNLVTNNTLTITFAATSTGWYIKTSGKTINSMVFNGSGGGWKFVDNAIITNNLTITTGSVVFNGRLITTGWFVFTGNLTRSVDIGSGGLTVTTNQYQVIASNNNYAFNASGTNQTIIPFTGKITFNLGISFNGGGKTYGRLYAYPPGLQYWYSSIVGANTFKSIHIVAVSATIGQFNILNDQTCTDTFEFKGYSRASRCFLRGKNKTGHINISAPVYLIQYADLQNIRPAIAIDLNAKDCGNCGDNDNITFATPIKRFAKMGSTSYSWSNTAMWSIVSGGSTGASIPIPGDTAVFDPNTLAADGKTLTADQISLPRVDFTNLTHTLIFNAGSGNSLCLMYDLISAGKISAGTGYYWFVSANLNATFDLTGTGNINPYLDFLNGTANIKGLNTTNTLYHYSGAFTQGGNNTVGAYEMDANDIGVTTPIFNGSSYTFTCTASQLPIYFTVSNIFNCNTSTIKLTGVVSSSDKAIRLSEDKTFYTLEIAPTSNNSAYWYNMTGVNMTITNLILRPGAWWKLTFNKTVTITGSLIATGTSGHLTYLTSNIGSAAPIILSSDPCLDYMNLLYVGMSIPVHVGANSVNGGGNINCSFTSCVSGNPMWLYDF